MSPWPMYAARSPRPAPHELPCDNRRSAAARRARTVAQITLGAATGGPSTSATRLVAPSARASPAERTSATTPHPASGGAATTEETPTRGTTTEQSTTEGCAASPATPGWPTPTAGAPTHQDHREHDDDDQDEHRTGRRRVSGRNDACHVPHATAHRPISERAATGDWS